MTELDSLHDHGTWHVFGRALRVTNLEKELFPPRAGESPVTKRELLRYAAVVAPVLLPYLKGRAINLRRYPNGVAARGFWQKELPSHAPAWLPRWDNPAADPGETRTYLVVDVRERGGLARLDYTQNAIDKTLVAPYSPRPAPGAPVSAPIEWEELDDLSLAPDRFTIRTVLDRIAERGDLFREVLDHGQRLPAGAHLTRDKYHRRSSVTRYSTSERRTSGSSLGLTLPSSSRTSRM